MSSSKLYIGNIPKDLSESDISTYFTTVCPHSTFSLVRAAKDDSSRAGFGFLKTGGNHEVKMVLANEHYVNGHLLKCEEYSGSEEPVPVRNSLRRRRLFIRNLKKTITDDEIFLFFSQYGELESAYSVKAHASTKSRSFGYVTFKEEEPALKLISWGKVTIKDIEISIHPFRKCVETANQINSDSQLANQITASGKSCNLIGQIPQPILNEEGAAQIDKSTYHHVSSHPLTSRRKSTEWSSHNSEDPFDSSKAQRSHYEHSSGISKDDYSVNQISPPYHTSRVRKNLSYNLFGQNFIKVKSQKFSSDSSAEENEIMLDAKRVMNKTSIQLHQTSSQTQVLASNRELIHCSTQVRSPAALDLWNRSAGNTNNPYLAHSSKPTRRNYFHREMRNLNHGPSNIEIKILTTPRPRWQAARSLEIPLSFNQQPNSFPSVF